jgi:hypothetical protein
MVPGLQRFLEEQPHMSIKPGVNPGLVIEGRFWFSAESEGRDSITDSYDLRLEVPEYFPGGIPRVTERDFRIPRTPSFHVNSDGTLCLGSPLRLLWKISQKPSLAGFASECLVPYLYAISHKLKLGGKFPFSELEHGTAGELADYADLFCLDSTAAARRTLEILRMKKRKANKLPCPCGCRKRLGKCEFNWTIRKFRGLLNGSGFRA